MESNQETFAALFGIGAVLAILLFSLVVLAFRVIVWWRILAKAGHPGPLALLIIVPLGGFLMEIVLAFTKWPVEKSLEELRQQVQPRQA